MKLFAVLLLLIMTPTEVLAAIIFIDYSEAEAEAGSGNITLDFPDTVASGDVAIACVYSRDNVAHTLTDWTEIVQGNGHLTTSRISAWWFRYAGSTPNLTVGHTGGNAIVGGIVIFRGVKASGSPVDATGTGAIMGASETTIEHASITPTTSNTMLIACNGVTDNQARDPIPPGFTCAWPVEFESDCSITTSLGSDASVALHYKIHVSGPTGTIVDTHTGSGTAGTASVLFALEAETVTATRRRIAPFVFGR